MDTLYYPGVAPVSVQRTWAALAAAGAWDATPTAVACVGVQKAVLICYYERGGAAGAFDIHIEVSPYSTDTNGLGQLVWADAGVEEMGVFAAGADTVSDLQRHGLVTYTATGAAAETVSYEIDLDGIIERIRVTARESGNVANPGELEIICSLR